MKIKTGLLLGLLLAVYWPPASAATPALPLVLTEAEYLSPNIIRIPFRLTGTLITVRARVDTLEGNFFFDTGASTLLLNKNYFGNPRTRILEGGGGVTGRVQVLGTVRIDSVKLENMIVADVMADILDLNHIETSKKVDLLGIIGYRVFEGYEVLFDYEASVLLLVRTAADGTPVEPVPAWEYKPLDTYPIRTKGHVAMLRLEFGSKKSKWFALDSGAEQNLLSNLLGGRFLNENFELLKRVKLHGMGQESLEVLKGLLKNAHLGERNFQPMATLLTNLREINAAYGTTVDGILGYEFFSQQALSINYRLKTLTFYTGVRP